MLGVGQVVCVRGGSSCLYCGEVVHLFMFPIQ